MELLEGLRFRAEGGRGRAVEDADLQGVVRGKAFERSGAVTRVNRMPRLACSEQATLGHERDARRACLSLSLGA